MMRTDIDCASHMKRRSRIFLAKSSLLDQDPYLTVMAFQARIVIVLVAMKKVDGVQQRARK